MLVSLQLVRFPCLLASLLPSPDCLWQAVAVDPTARPWVDVVPYACVKVRPFLEVPPLQDPGQLLLLHNTLHHRSVFGQALVDTRPCFHCQM